MIMTAATVNQAVLIAQLVIMTSLLTEQNVVTLPGIFSVLTVQHWKQIITGIVQAVPVPVTLSQNVVMVPAPVTKTVKPVKLTAVSAVNVPKVL